MTTYQTTETLTHDALRPAGEIEQTEDGLYAPDHVPSGVESETVKATAAVLAQITEAGADGCDPTDYVVIMVGRRHDLDAGRADVRVIATHEEGLLAEALDAESRDSDLLVYATSETTGRVEVVSADRAIDEETGEVRVDYVAFDAESAFLAATETVTAANHHRVRSGRAALAALAGR